MDSSDDKRWDVASIGIVVLFALYVALTFEGRGVAWDEPIHVDYGRYVLARLLGETVDARAFTDFPYVGGFDVLGACLERVLGELDPYRVRHLLGGLVGVLGVIGTQRLGDALAGPRAGFFSALTIACTPMFAGASFDNPKDPPAAVGYVWALVAVVALAERGLSARGRDFAWLALATTFAIATRPTGGVVVMYAAAALIAAAVVHYRDRRHAMATLERLAPRLAMLIVASVVPYALMVALWPATWSRPFVAPLEGVLQLLHFTRFNDGGWFAGEVVAPNRLPRGYAAWYVAIQLPELALVGLAACGLLARRHVRVKPAFAVTALAAAFPLLWAAVTGAHLYNAGRQLLFVVPPLAALAGCGWSFAIAQLGERFRLASALVPSALAIAQIAQIAALHPVEYVDYNVLAGGVRGAYDRYDLDSSGASYRELFRALADRVYRESPDVFAHHGVTVSGCLSYEMAKPVLPPGVRYTTRRNADFVAGDHTPGCLRRRPERPYVAVERSGVELTWIDDQR